MEPVAPSSVIRFMPIPRYTPPNRRVRRWNSAIAP